MSVPLDGLPDGVTQLRLRTNQEIYWDRIAVAYAEPLQDLKRQSLALHSARIKASGFALRTTSGQGLPNYDYGRRVPLWDTRHLAGFYTEFGPADRLVAEADDALAIFGPGEEIHLEFDAAAEPLPDGWTRTFVLETDGWVKDMDLFTRDGNTLEPLPLKRSSTERRDRLHTRFNTRYRSGT
jgi:hypothetical protein